MKHTKRPLAFLLAVLILAFSFSLPAMADDPSEELPEPDPCPYCDQYDPCSRMPVITSQQRRVRIRTGQSIRLGVRVNVPSRDELGARWYRGETYLGSRNVNPWRQNVPRDSFFSLSINETGYFDYYAVVYNRAHPDHYVVSETIRIEVYEPSGWLLFREGFFEGIAPAMTPFAMVLWGVMLTTLADRCSFSLRSR